MTATDKRFAGYEIEEFLGEGAVGEIYRARDARLHRQVALRIVAADLTRDPVTRERLNREATALGRVDHPNVAPIYDAGTASGRLYVATRWVDGLNLEQIVGRDGPLEARRAVRIVNQVAAALQAAHDLGIVHRNVKPSSILITADDHVYLTEFGLARRAGDPSGLTEQKALLEDFDYVPPEYIEGGRIDHRADIYGLGCVLYEALTGEVPYPQPGPAAKMYAHVSLDPPSPRSHRPDVPPQLDEVVRRAMAKGPEDRQASAGEFAAEAAGATEMSAPPWARRGGPAATTSFAAQMEPRAEEPAAEGRVAEDWAGEAPAAASRAAPEGDPVSHDGYYEPVYYQGGRRSLPRLLLWALAVLVFLGAPVALLIALL